MKIPKKTIITVFSIFFLILWISLLLRNIFYTPKIHFAIAPHFMFDTQPVEKLYQNLSRTIGNKKLDIILISPNHFNKCKQNLCSISSEASVNYKWHKIKMNPIQDLFKDNLSEIGWSTWKNNFINKDDLFYSFNNQVQTDEHGLWEHFYFISKYFSWSKIYPLVIKPSITQAQLQKLLDPKLKSPKDILIIASVDFSHYVSESYARIHDKHSKYTLYQSTWRDQFQSCEVDCPSCLRLIKNRASKFWKHPHLFHKDFAFANDTESTSRQLFTFDSNKSEENWITLIAFGDTIYTRFVQSKYPSKEKLYQHFSDFFQQNNISSNLHLTKHRKLFGVDLVWWNLESPIWSWKDCLTIQSWKNIVFCSTARSLEIFKNIWFDLFNISNNHSLDQWRTGLQKTINHIKNYNLIPIGTLQTWNNISQNISTGSTRGINYAIHGFDLTHWQKNINLYCDQLKNYKNFQNIVFVHRWNEYQTSHSKEQERMWETLIDCWADLVIWSHPHVVQDIWRYQNKPIIYSLWNFLFDQNFSGGVAMIDLWKKTIEIKIESF